MTSPIQHLADTPSLENAIARIGRQMILDGIVITRQELLGGGKFAMHTNDSVFGYEWSHVSGTRLVMVRTPQPYGNDFPKYDIPTYLKRIGLINGAMVYSAYN